MATTDISTDALAALVEQAQTALRATDAELPAAGASEAKEQSSRRKGRGADKTPEDPQCAAIATGLRNWFIATDRKRRRLVVDGVKVPLFKATLAQLTRAAQTELQTGRKRARVTGFKETLTHWREMKQTAVLQSPDIVDCERLDSLSDELKAQVVASTISWRGAPQVAYTFRDKPGLWLIPRVFDVAEQEQWVRRSLRQYLTEDNFTNLRRLGKPAHALWHAHVSGHEHKGDEPQLGDVTWATLGYHYNWTIRSYAADEFTPFPKELALVSRDVAQAVSQDIIGEAGIVNYYTNKAVMNGHQDDLEFMYDAPVVSFSLGCTAVFLIGTADKDVAPVPLLLRSGDVVVMGGSSRLAFHGVACILQHSSVELFAGTPDPALATSCDGHKHEGPDGDAYCAREELTFREYMKTHRVNLNVRQVLPTNGKFPEEPIAAAKAAKAAALGITEDQLSPAHSDAYNSDAE